MSAAGPARTVILDSQAVQMLRDPSRDIQRARAVLARIEVTARRKRAGTSVDVLVPTTVRAEAMWNRCDPSAAGINRHRIRDLPLDADGGNVAAALRSALGPTISVADAHIGAALQATKTSGPHAALTSDRPDMHLIADHLGIPISVMRV